MATSKGRNSASSKSAGSNKSSASSKGSSKSTGTSSSSSSRGADKTIPPVKGGSSSGKGASSKAAKSAGSARAAGSGASKSAVSKSAASPRNGNAGKASAGRGTAVKSSGGSNGSAARGSAASRNTSARASSARASKSVKAGDARNDLEKILQDLMKDIYYAEKKLTKALGKMAKNATDPKLKDAFTTHQSQTEEQVAKLEEAFQVLGQTPKAKKCAAMDGLLEEANEHIEEYEKGAGLDAALIVGAQKVEHYEIAAYGSMRSFAKTLGYDEAADIFEQIREQESDTDELLTTLAESVINLKAEEETEDVSASAKSGAGKSSNAAGSNGNSNSSSRGSEDSEAGEDSSSRSSGNGNGREGGDDAMMSGEMSGGSISGMTDGNNREGASETGEAMGY